MNTLAYYTYKQTTVMIVDGELVNGNTHVQYRSKKILKYRTIGAVLVRSKYTEGTPEVRSRCGRGMYARSMVEVRSRYAQGTLEVRSGVTSLGKSYS